jgi:hypothetical protein
MPVMFIGGRTALPGPRDARRTPHKDIFAILCVLCAFAVLIQ